MGRVRLVTLAIVAAAGAAVAWWGLPALREAAALRAIVHDDPGRRAQGWDTLTPAIPRRIDDIHARLETASDAALLDAAEHLSWTWDRVPHGLLLREIAARARLGEPLGLRLALELMENAPLDLDPGDVIPAFDALLAGPLARETLDAACAWAGPDGGATLAALTLPNDDIELRRAWLMALVFTDQPRRAFEFSRVHAGFSGRYLEPTLLALAEFAPDNAGAALAIADMSPPARGTPPWSVILRRFDDPVARAELRRLADKGDDAARYALQAADPQREAEVARRVARDRKQPPWRRRLAAWRLPDTQPELLEEILAEPPADPGGSVYSAALLAERLPDAEATAEAWIRDFDDDRKRAGALLAALLDTHADLLADAHDREDRPEVRTLQHLALSALTADNPPDPDPDPVELAHRTPAGPDGTPPPDLLAALLAAGRPEALDWLTQQPPNPWNDPAATMRHRAWLIERFVPRWHEQLGRPIGGDVEGLRLHLEMLRALASLDRRRLRFDPGSRTFVDAAAEQQQVTGGD